MIDDSSSRKGTFGWVTLGNGVNIPYIQRGEENFVSVKMVEEKLLSKYLKHFNTDFCTLTNIQSRYITESEARLFGQINVWHCNGMFGKHIFTINDLIVGMEDVREYYMFLKFCYSKLTQPLSAEPNNRCGFVRINNTSVVPYTVNDNNQFAPLFYFEDDSLVLNTICTIMRGWDLVYLKFCCRIQGIHSELVEGEECQVVNLIDVRRYFPRGTRFVEYWPTNDSTRELFRRRNQESCCLGAWTRTIPRTPEEIAAIQARPPLLQIRDASSTNHLGTVNFPQGVLIMNSYVRPQSNTQAAHHAQVHLGPAKRRFPTPFIPHQPQKIPSMSGNQTPHSLHPVAGPSRQTQQDSTYISTTHIPDHSIQKVQISGKSIECINLTPYVFTEMLISVGDLLNTLFGDVKLEMGLKVLNEVLKLKIYQATMAQRSVLQAHKKIRKINDFYPLIHLNDVLRYMPQIKYMLERKKN